jgi:hypothetical protein
VEDEMTQTPQTTPDPAWMIPSLCTKLRELAEALTPEEAAQLGALTSQADTDALSSSLQAKLSQCAVGFTPEEAAQVRGLLGEVDAGVSSAADTRGYAIDQYADNNPSDPLQGHLHRGMPVATGRDPGQVITQVGSDLAALIRPLGRFLPF